MSFVNNVSYTNLKESTARHVLGAITLIFGPNRSNKTSIVDAIKVALLGYYPDPDVPKTNGGAMQLASSNQMTVSIEMADGRAVTRIYSTDGKSVTSTVSPAGFKIHPMLAVCLDHSLYFGKTDAERVQQVMQMTEGLGVKDRMPALVARLKQLKLDDHNESAEKQLVTLLAEVPGCSQNLTMQQWLGLVLTWAKEQYTVANGTYKSMLETSKTLTEANAIDTLSNVETQEALEAELATLKAKQLTINQSWGRTKNQAAEIEKDFARRESLKRQLAELGTQEDVTVIEKEIDLLAAKRAERDRLISELLVKMSEYSDVVRQTTASRDEAGVKHREMAKVREKYRNEIDACFKQEVADPAYLLTQNAITVMQEDLRGLEKDINKAKEKIDHINQQPSCPVCMSQSPGWRDTALLSYKNELHKVITDLNSLMAKRDVAVDELERMLDIHNKEVAAKVESIRAQLNATDAEFAESQTVYNGLCEKIDQANNNYIAAADEVKKQRHECGVIDASISRLRADIDEKSKSIGRRFSLEDQIKTLDALLPATIPVPTEPVDLADAKRAVFDVESRLKVFIAQQQEAKRIKEVQEAAVKANQRRLLIQKIGETIKDEQAKIVADAFEPVLTLANKLCDGILDAPLIYDNGLVGRVSKKTGRFFSVGTFSGSEKRLAFVAISSALARQSPDRIAIIDELGTFDVPTQSLLVQNIGRVIESGELHQVILLSPQPYLGTPLAKMVMITTH